MPGRPYIDVVENKGWQLYDITTEFDNELPIPGWNDLALRGVATQIVHGGVYIFAPQPGPSQTQQEARAIVQGIGPCLRIENVDAPEYAMLRLRFSPSFAVFTRLALIDAGVYLHSAPLPDGRPMDKVLLHSETAAEVFERTFDIISPQEFFTEAARHSSPN